MAKRTVTRSSTPLQGQRGSYPTPQSPAPATQPSKEVPGSGIQSQAAPRPGGLSEDAHTVIAKRAYEIWKSQGGSELENWLKAEREVNDQMSAGT